MKFTPERKPSVQSKTIEQRVAEVGRIRSASNKIYVRAIKEGTELKVGAGKGLEPKPWCDCHNRNPCPIDIEIARG